jgi:hypothetical protein
MTNLRTEATDRRGSYVQWRFRMRSFVARRFLRLGFRCADVATYLAPWVDD